jgi:hypothetical protein
MRIAKLFFMSALMATVCFASTRKPVALWSTPGENEVSALAANHGIVAVSYGNTHGGSPENTIQLYQDLGSWQQIATLTVSDGNAVVYSVALTEGYLVAGTLDPVSGEGAACVFVKPNTGWQNATETAELLPSDPTNPDAFGWSVSAWGPTVVVASPSGVPKTEGVAYIYQQPAAGWVNATQNAELRTSDGHAEVGYSVAISGEVGGDGSEIALGGPYNSPDAVYVFQEPSGGWTDMTQTAILTNSGGQAGDNLGQSVAMSSNVIVAGAPFATINGFPVGELEVYVKPQGGWADTSQPTATLTDPSSDMLGYSVGITQSGGQIVACCGPFPRNRMANEAYLFTGPNGGWVSQGSASFRLKLTQPNDDAFIVAITKGFAVVGGFDHSNTPDVGTYIFKAQ